MKTVGMMLSHWYVLKDDSIYPVAPHHCGTGGWISSDVELNIENFEELLTIGISRKRTVLK